MAAGGRFEKFQIMLSRVVAEKPRDAVVKLNTHRNLQRHRKVLPAIAWLSCSLSVVAER